MLLGKVKNRVVSTAHLETLPARQLLTVTVEDGFGDPEQEIIAIDGVSAGPGDRVIVMQEGTGAREVVLEDKNQPLPAHAVIVGVVDHIDESP